MRRIVFSTLALLAAAPAFADDTPDLVWGGDLSAKVQGGITSVNRSKPRVGVFSDAEANFWANYRDWLGINAKLALERTRDSSLNSYYPSTNAAFRSEAMTLRQLYATIRPGGGVEVSIGKFHTNFGAGWEQTPGQFYSFASDYEQDERVGVRLEARAPESWGVGELRAVMEVFMLDTSVLSGTFPRGPSLNDPNADRFLRYTRGGYGASNTGSLASWTATLKGGKEGRGLAWQASYTRQATSDPAARAEEGMVASASYDPTGDGIALTPRVGITPFIEYARMSNAQTVPGLTRQYLLGGLTVKSGKWELGLASALRQSSGVATGTDHQESVTLTYEVLDGFKAGAGVHHITLGGRGSWTLAPALAYEVNF